MTNIVVLVKQVPDTYSERKLTEADHTLDRESADAVLDEINERAVEEALKIKEAGEGEVTVVCVGPDRATDAIRKALSMGADKAIHVSDESLHGTDVIGTAKVIAEGALTEPVAASTGEQVAWTRFETDTEGNPVSSTVIGKCLSITPF
jgi:electron transfer flavoprotein beta subunit